MGCGRVLFEELIKVTSKEWVFWLSSINIIRLNFKSFTQPGQERVSSNFNIILDHRRLCQTFVFLNQVVDNITDNSL